LIGYARSYPYKLYKCKKEVRLLHGRIPDRAHEQDLARCCVLDGEQEGSVDGDVVFADHGAFVPDSDECVNCMERV